MADYYHALRVDPELCQGHLVCMRRCPTQAIRIRRNKAVISEELCVDCGTCINSCTAGAILPISDPVDRIASFKYKVLVPTAVLYSQFDPEIHPHVIRQACKAIGFDDVVDVSS